MIKPDQLEKISSLILGGIPPKSRDAILVVDLCYRGDPSIQNLSYTVAILYALAEPNTAVHIIDLGGPFDAEEFWTVVRELSNSGIGELFRTYDGRSLTDSLVTNGRTVTYFVGQEEESNETTE